MGNSSYLYDFKYQSSSSKIKPSHSKLRNKHIWKVTKDPTIKQCVFKKDEKLWKGKKIEKVYSYRI